MNFFPNPNIPNYNNELINNLLYRLNEQENKIKKLEQRITRLENTTNFNNYQEPDTSLYMI